jgi:hypothetical protein
MGLNLRDILDPKAAFHGPVTEIDILKPDRMKPLIEPVQGFPYVAADHEKRTCRLFHRPRQVEIAVQIPVALVDGIGRPQTIDA